MRKETEEMRADQTGWLPDYVAQWEAREHQFRKTLEAHKAEVDRRYGVLLGNMSDTVAQKQAQLLRIREIPVIGKWLIRYSEKNVE